MDRVFDTDYRVEAHNAFRHQVLPWRCSNSRTTTWRFSVSATVKAEAGVIFAKAEASATAGIDHEVSTVDEAETVMKIRPRSWAHCVRGAYHYKAKGNVRTQFKKSRHGTIGWWYGSNKDFIADVPSSAVYIYGPGRL